MKGQVAEYDEAAGTGVIVNANGRRFTFTRADWQPELTPAPGQKVIFAPEDAAAHAIGLPEPEPAFHSAERNLVWLWTAVEGRATRGDFWLRFFLIALVILFAAGFIDGASGSRYRPSYTLGIIANVVLFWPALAVGIKRFHDCGMPGYHVVVLLIMQVVVSLLLYKLVDERVIRSATTVYVIQAVPFLYGLWQFIVMGFFAGTEGENEYGPDPRGYVRSEFSPGRDGG